MVFLDDPVSLINHTIENFEIKSDIHSLERTNEHLQAIQRARTAVVDEQRNSLLGMHTPLSALLPS